MQIRILGQPLAGERFHFEVIGGSKPTHIEVYVDRGMVFDHDCPDPPCHESIFVPAQARGSQIWIIARDIYGKVEQETIYVVDSDASTGGMMSTEG